MMKKLYTPINNLKRSILLLLSLVALSINAQDILFSQFYSAPLVLNPALTGFSSGDAQFVMNYRNNQQGLIPYNTMAFSGDMKLARPIFKPDILAAGIMVASDQFNGGQMGSLNILASGAYHYQINKSNFVSGGIQLGLFQRTVDPNSFSYGDQYDPVTGYDPSLSNGESFSSEKSFNFDFNLGVFYYSMLGEKTSLYAGYSMFHVNSPEDKFENPYAEPASFPIRYVVHGGLRTSLSDELDIVPNFIVMMQNKNISVTEGLTAVYSIENTGVAIDFGAWYRHSDNCLIGTLGLRYSGFQFLFSSDFISHLQYVSSTSGAFEFSVKYNLSFTKKASLNANPRNKY